MEQNLLKNVLEAGLSHSVMTALICANYEEKESKFTSEEEKALVAITSVYFAKHFVGESPYELYKVLKDSNYKFKGVYEPLNNVSTEKYLTFLTGDLFEEEVTKPKIIVTGEIIKYQHFDKMKYGMVEKVDKDFVVVWSRMDGFSTVSTSDILTIDSEKEFLIAKVVIDYQEGEVIEAYEQDCLMLSIVPVKVDGNGHMYYLDKSNNTVSLDCYDSLAEMLQALFKPHKIDYVENM